MAIAGAQSAHSMEEDIEIDASLWVERSGAILKKESASLVSLDLFLVACKWEDPDSSSSSLCCA